MLPQNFCGATTYASSIWHGPPLALVLLHAFWGISAPKGICKQNIDDAVAEAVGAAAGALARVQKA
eukprot:511425-Karenia_brevis.AAC.1